jgi:FAD:protein FMN transferase
VNAEVRLRCRLSALLLILLGAAPRAFQGVAESREFRFLMGTSVQVRAFGGDEPARRAAIDEAFGAIAEVDRLMSNYRADSELTHINAAAARGPVVVSDPMLRILEAAQKVSADSNGAFDVTVGPLVRLWGFFDKRPHVPSAQELAAVRPLVGFRNLLVDAQQHAVRFVRPGVEIDLGGIAKGFAVEVAADVLRRRGLQGFIDAGGNQYMVGAPPGKTQWTVGVKNPDGAGQLLGAIDVTEGSVSTSADDANFLVAAGRRYGHLLDPRSLTPSTMSLSATIVSRDGTLADALSKAAFVLGPKDGLALVDSYPGTAAAIAYRKADGSVGVVISQRLVGRFHPAKS